MLVYALGQSPAQATTGSLVVVGVTALIGAVTAYRAGNVLFARGVTFGLVDTGAQRSAPRRLRWSRRRYYWRRSRC